MIILYRKKTLETVTSLKATRRRSPVPSKKHGERGEKGGISNTSGGGASGTSGTLLNTPHNSSTSAHLSPAASSLALPATPSTQSLLSVGDERNHSNLQSTVSAPSGVVDSCGVAVGAVVPKTVEDQSLDDDPVKRI